MGEGIGSITVTVRVLSDGISGETTVGLSTISGTATGELTSQLQCCHGYSIVIVVIAENVASQRKKNYFLT